MINRTRAVRWLALGSLVAATATAYAPSLAGPFTFDDDRVIVHGADLNDPAKVTADLPSSLLGRSRAVTDLTFAFDRSLHGLAPASFRLTNLLIHLALSLTLVALGATILRRAGLASEPVAYVAAGFWALHPLGSQAVAYVSQRYESLSSLFYAGAMLLGMRSETSRRPALLYALATSLVILGLGAKGLTVTAFALLALAAATFPVPPGPVNWRSITLRSAPWFCASLVFAAGSAIRLEGNPAAGFAMADVSPGDYWLAQGQVLRTYVQLVFWPTRQSIDHDFPAAGGADGPTLAGWLFVMALGALSLAAVLRRGSKEVDPAIRVAGFGGLWFLILLAPTSALPIADLLVEHRAYLASWGLILAAVALGAAVLRRTVANARLRAVFATLLVAAGTGAAAAALVDRARLWGDDVALWRDAVEQAPAYYRPHNNLADALRKSGDKEGATREWQLAARLWPEAMVAGALRDVASIRALASAGRREEARALAERVRARTMPTPRVLLPLAESQVVLGDPRAAELTLSWVFRLAEPTPDALAILAHVYAAEKRFDLAISVASDAVELSGGAAPARIALAQTLAASGRLAEACAALASGGPPSAELDAAARSLACRR